MKRKEKKQKPEFVDDGRTIANMDYENITGYKSKEERQKHEELRSLNLSNSVSVAVYERSTASFSRQYKAYYIDRENGLVGLHVYDWSGKFNGYVLLHFNGYELKEVCALALTSNAPDLTRATIVDGWLYVLSPHDNMAVWQLSAQEAPAA